MITLKNARRELFEATEYHELVCRRRNECKCRAEMVTGPDAKQVSKLHPRDIRIEGGKTSEPLDPAVLLVPQVKEAISLGWLQRADLKE